MPDDRQITNNAPVMPIEWPVTEDGDNTIYTCHECYPWYAEVVLDHPSGDVVVREWHAVGCAALARWMDGEAPKVED